MIHESEGRVIVYRFLELEDIPYVITVVRDPDIGGYTSYMRDYNGPVGEGGTLKESIFLLLEAYNELRKIKFYKYNRIGEILAQRGISQRWLSRQLGFDYDIIYYYTRKDNPRQARMKRLEEIAKILNVSVDYLVTPEQVMSYEDKLKLKYQIKSRK